MGSTVYPFDPTGQLVANKIDEQQILPTGELTDYLFIVPKIAPFFKASMKVYHIEKAKYLTEGVDYVFTHFYKTASVSIGKAIYGSITFYDKTITGAVRLTYQTIGGEWTVDYDAIMTMLATKLLNPRITYWDAVITAPTTFPVIEHDWNVKDLIGLVDVRNALLDIKTAINAKNTNVPSIMATHLTNYENPHRLTATQLGLGAVKNYGIATYTDAIAGTSNALYMTPARTKDAIIGVIDAVYAGHFNNTNNPHNTTKVQVSLGSVQNYGIATLDEALLGETDLKYMTPSKTSAYVNKRVSDLLGTSETVSTLAVASHLRDMANPHRVNAAQVGLSAVQNFGLASENDALLGEQKEAYMTPYLTQLVVNAAVSAAATGNTNNVLNVRPGSSGDNIALGTPSTQGTLLGLTTGWGNIAAGSWAAYNCSTGFRNIFLGDNAGPSIGSGSENIMIGSHAGEGLYSSSSDNICLGYHTGCDVGGSYSNIIAMGNSAKVTGSNQVQLGNSNSTTYVYGTVQNRSDARDKADIVSTTLGIDFIMGLRPVEGVWDLREDYVEYVEHTVDADKSTMVKVQHPRDGSRKRNRKHQWFIAQEVKVLADRLGVDFGGYQDHSVCGGGDVLSLGYDEFIPPVVKAIQDCWNRMDDIELRLMKLEEA